MHKRDRDERLKADADPDQGSLAALLRISPEEVAEARETAREKMRSAKWHSENHDEVPRATRTNR